MKEGRKQNGQIAAIICRGVWNLAPGVFERTSLLLLEGSSGITPEPGQSALTSLPEPPPAPAPGLGTPVTRFPERGRRGGRVIIKGQVGT